VPAFDPVVQPDEPAYAVLQNTCAGTFRHQPGRYHNGGLWPMVAGFWVLAAAVPVAVTVLVMAALQPTARRLRLLGWSLVAANLLSLIAVVTTLRIIQDFHAVEPTLPFPMF